MKTSLLVLASLALGTAAIAQDASAPQTPPAATPMPDATAPAAPATTAPDASMPAATNSAAPAPDASAMPAPATTSTPDAMATASATDTSNYPTCSRSVTDKCVQRGAVHRSHRR